MTPEMERAQAWQNQLADRTDRDCVVYAAGLRVGASHEREECAGIAKEEEEAHAGLARKAKGAAEERYRKHHVMGRAVASVIKQRIHARGNL